jgi:glycosyltransferase involved in cell wall biosynthesis
MSCHEISVITPCRNGAAYLAEAVASIAAQHVDAEVVVVDDGSTDLTADIVASLGCKVIFIPHSGLSAARNVGLKAAQGEYLLFLDRDDVMTDGALQQIFAAFTDDAHCVSAKVRDFVSSKLSEEDKSIPAPRSEPYGGLLTGAYLFKRTIFERVGCFNEKFQTEQGVDFLPRCTEADCMRGS